MVVCLLERVRKLQLAQSSVDLSSAKLAEEVKASEAASATLQAERAAFAVDLDLRKAQVEQLKRCVSACACESLVIMCPVPGDRSFFMDGLVHG